MTDIASILDELNPKQRQALEALGTARTLTQVAKEVGISRETLRVWLLEPGFRAAHRELKVLTFEGVAVGLLNLGEKAVEGYAEVLANPAMPGNMTLSRTSEAVIGQLFRLRELMDIEERLEAIEARLGEVSDGIGK